MYGKLEELEQQFNELTAKLSDPAVISDHDKFRKLSKQYSDLSTYMDPYRKLKKLTARITEAQELINNKDEDKDIRDLAKEELAEALTQKERLEAELTVLLTPSDPNDAKNVLLEIRSGTGGEEAALFAGDLFRMYMRYAERRGWRTEILTSHPTGIGGYKEVITLIEGNRAFSKLKYEGGVHRVQRVPATEASGRIHTSAVTVAVMPEAEDVEVDIKPEDLRIDVYRSSGPGGQSVNTTDSAVRITHIPSGLVVACQDEKSQLKNKHKGLKILRARLLQLAEDEQMEKISSERKAMVGTGDRSAKIRTYNYPQSRITDHRINLTLYRLDAVLDGDLDDLIEKLNSHYEALRLQESLEQQIA